MPRGMACPPAPPAAYEVLLVEDSPGDASLISEQLAGLGPAVRISTVSTLAAARAAMAQAPYDCVLLDLTLPDGEGLDGLTALSSTEGPAVVVLTGHPADGLALEALARGADDYLVKGSPADLVARTVRYGIERRVGRRLLREQEARFGWAVESLREGIVIYDEDGGVAQHNDAARRLLGFAPRPLCQLRTAGTTPFVHPDGSPLAPGEHPCVVAFETRRAVVGMTTGVRLPDGGTRWFLINATPVGGHEGLGGTGLVCSFEDVTDRHRAVQALEELTLRDPLTGLPNRGLVLDRLEQSLRRSGPGKGWAAVVLVDVDGFNSINDSYGFAAGDDLLIELARRLSAAAPGSTVGRLSADTFAAVVEGLGDPDEVVEAARRLREAATGRFELEGADCYLDCSAGAALGHEEVTAESLVRNADLALHRAKAAGGGHGLVYEDGDLAAVRDRLELERDLRQAIARRELTIAYQPIVCTTDLAVVGAEALARWHHPRRGPVSPERFVELATALGLVRTLTRQVLEAACQQVVRWQTDGVVGGEFRVSVNMSAADLVDPGLPEEVLAILARTGLDAGCLTVEVTETALVRDTETALGVLEAVRHLGVHVAIDDFGTGYSSLSYLKRFPIDVVKVDKSFVQGLGNDPEATTLVRGIVSLARGVGLVTVAEGIENGVQLEALRQMGCTFAQGYLWSAPVSATCFPSCLAEVAAASLSGAAGWRPPAAIARELGDGLAWATLDSLRFPLAVVDTDGRICATNLHWQRLALERGAEADSDVGASYFEVCDRVLGPCGAEAATAENGIQAVLAGAEGRFALEYDCHGTECPRRYLLLAWPLVGRTGMAVVAHLDIDDRHRAEVALAESHRHLRDLVEQLVEGRSSVRPSSGEPTGRQTSDVSSSDVSPAAKVAHGP